MSFSFDFSGEDIDESLDQNGNDVEMSNAEGQAVADHHEGEAGAAVVDVKQHDFNELLSSLPDRLSYSLVTITSPTGKTLVLPRRELFDIRVQLMSEADGEDDNDRTLADLENSDLRTGVYEGGFKTWECSVDLASLLLDRGPRKDIDEIVKCDQVIELGAGTALPSLTLFAHCIRERIPQSFTLADYNASVLSLVTLPNLLLTWALHTTTTPEALVDPTSSLDNSGDLELSPALLSAFTSSLAEIGIHLTFLSGPWSPALSSLIPASAPEMGTLILASETIYSPASTSAFVTLLISLLSRVKMAKAIVAAKRVYFGVGGSVDALKVECAERGAVAYEVENSGVKGVDRGIEGGGVGRALVEVQMY
ncbi:hypothetical protein AAFC00_000713 [Neodothiora populina]|uniref:protein-histidine N-methyltransferase n=1 Tax=Neodothiora populina TaxID=2781224 RepID=A0ABR3PDZ0_9PEZI